MTSKKKKEAQVMTHAEWTRIYGRGGGEAPQRRESGYLDKEDPGNGTHYLPKRSLIWGGRAEKRETKLYGTKGDNTQIARGGGMFNRQRGTNSLIIDFVERVIA